MADFTHLVARLSAGPPTILHQLHYVDLADAIAILARATVDASPGEGRSCFYCLADRHEHHQASCPVPVAHALLRFTDD